MIDRNHSEHTSRPFICYLDALPLAPWLASASRISVLHVHTYTLWLTNHASCASRFSLFVSLFAPLHAPPARHSEGPVARPFRSPTIALSSRMPYCNMDANSWQSLSSPSWLSSGEDRAPSAPVLAAVEADARCIAKGQHAALHDAERDARCARSLTA